MQERYLKKLVRYLVAFFYFFAKQKKQILQHEIKKTTTKKRQSNANRVINNKLTKNKNYFKMSLQQAAAATAKVFEKIASEKTIDKTKKCN